MYSGLHPGTDQPARVADDDELGPTVALGGHVDQHRGVPAARPAPHRPHAADRTATARVDADPILALPDSRSPPRACDLSALRPYDGSGARPHTPHTAHRSGFHHVASIVGPTARTMAVRHREPLRRAQNTPVTCPTIAPDGVWGRCRHAAGWDPVATDIRDRPHRPSGRHPRTSPGLRRRTHNECPQGRRPRPRRGAR